MGGDLICIPKAEGGLGIPRLHEVCQVFVLSLVRKLFTMAGSLWVAWVKMNLIRQGSFWDARDVEDIV